MHVNVKISDWFKKFTGGICEFELELIVGQSTYDIAEKLRIPREELGFVTINNVRRGLDVVLDEGDNIRLYPVIIGG